MPSTIFTGITWRWGDTYPIGSEQHLVPQQRKSQAPKPLTVLQVWISAELDASGRVKFSGTSDSELSRGLCAVLVTALSGLTPEEVLQVG